MKLARSSLLFFLICLLLTGQPLIAVSNSSGSGESYLSVTKLATSIGMQVKRSSDGKRLSYKVTSKYSTLELEEGKRTCTVNGIQMHLSRALIARESGLYISRSDYKNTIEPLILPQNFAPAPNVKVIVIDPGHGGRDDGAQNKSLGIKEKTLTLDLANRLKKELEDRGYTVYLTRSKDVFPSLEQRPAKAASLKADLFISLHFNASTDKSVKGAETYILPPNGQPSTSGTQGDGETLSGNKWDPWNAVLGYYVQRELTNSVGAHDRGLRRARFAVLRTLKCPGILVESGYVSNQSEGYKLSTSAYRQKIADGIADAVDAYARTAKKVSSK